MAKVPDSFVDLDLARVSRVLAKHYGDVYAAARDLGVSGPDLKQLTWARPDVLEEAHDEMDVVVARAYGELIRALFDPDSGDRRREWAAEKILSSWVARNSPYAPARRGPPAGVVYR
jgi:hypothetical protein